MENLNTYIDQAEAAITTLLKEWRPKLMASYGTVEFDLKDDRTVVTQLDGDLELAIKDVLRPLGDQVGFLGEEHGLEGPEDAFWLIDPIDGTEQYIRGMTACRTLLCLVVGDEPVYALAYRFTTDDFFTARKGMGTHKNGQHIRVKSRELRRAWIEASYNMQDIRVLEVMKSMHAQVGSVIYAHEFLNAVEGFIDGYVVYGAKGKLWDYVPRALLMAEAGLTVTNVGSASYDYKNLSLLAAHPDLHHQLEQLLSPLT